MARSTEVALALHQNLAPGAAVPVVASARAGTIGAVEVKVERDKVVTASLPTAACWLFVLRLDGSVCDDKAAELGRASTSSDQGRTLIMDLAERAQVRFRSFHALKIVLGRDALEEASKSLNALPSDRFSLDTGSEVDDETIRRLGSLLLQEMVCGARSQSLFVDYLLRAFSLHVAVRYGHVNPGSQGRRGVLAAWQLRRAQEMLRDNLEGSTSLEDVAAACRLSVSYFSRAFRRSTGLAPHSWLQKQRIEAAKSLLRTRASSLSEIAVACGFADQSHFTRVFHREVGSSPGVWRKLVVASVEPLWVVSDPERDTGAGAP